MRKVLAAAISGSRTQAAGLIVWGIPIADPNLFMTRLVKHVAAATSPAVDGVQHRLIEAEGGLFAVTFAPESDRGAHMAKLGEDRHFKRSGDQFRRVEHFDIADMFGRRRRPVLAVTLETEGHGETIRVSITNRGRGIAKAPYLTLTPPKNWQSSTHGYDGGGTLGLRRIGRDAIWRFGSDATEVIHAGQTLLGHAAGIRRATTKRYSRRQWAAGFSLRACR
jgi:hypothetical protein